MFTTRAKLITIGRSYEKVHRNGVKVRKVMLHLDAGDERIGKKLFFAEIRNSLIDVFYTFDPVEGDIFDVGFTFEGSEKRGKTYNNIIVTSINRIIT